MTTFKTNKIEREEFRVFIEYARPRVDHQALGPFASYDEARENLEVLLRDNSHKQIEANIRIQSRKISAWQDSVFVPVQMPGQLGLLGC